MRIIDCEQLSEKWWRVRRGIPTASRFDCILTPTTMKPAAAQTGYIHELIADTIRLSPALTTDRGKPITPEMAYGIDTEPEARAWYEFERGLEAQRVGFVLTDDGRFGCSPDGLVGTDGGLEIKCPALKTHVRYLLEGGLPPEYRCQVHGSLIVTGRPWWDFLSYATDMPALLVRVEPDDFTARLAEELEHFHARYEVDRSQILALLGPLPDVVIMAGATGQAADDGSADPASRQLLAQVAAAASRAQLSVEAVADYCRARGWIPEALSESQAVAVLSWIAGQSPFTE